MRWGTDVNYENSRVDPQGLSAHSGIAKRTLPTSCSSGAENQVCADVQLGTFHALLAVSMSALHFTLKDLSSACTRQIRHFLAATPGVHGDRTYGKVTYLCNATSINSRSQAEAMWSNNFSRTWFPSCTIHIMHESSRFSRFLESGLRDVNISCWLTSFLVQVIRSLGKSHLHCLQALRFSINDVCLQ